jgi:hypothetical protein
MNFDSYLDPPDHPEPPDWYVMLETLIDQEDPPKSVADAIRKAIDAWNQEQSAQHDIDPAWEQNTVEEPPLDNEPHCPHGRDWGICDTCDHLGDLAHDAAREARLFR